MDGRGQAIRKIRLAYVVSHPIQYQANLLRRIAADPSIDLTVFFCSDFSVRGYQDKGFGVAVAWDVPLLEGYRSVVMPRRRDTTSPSPLRPIAWGFFRHLRRGVDGQPFDALWVHGYASLNSLHAMFAARALGIPVLLRAESWLHDRERSRVKLLAKNIFFRGLRRLVDAVLPIGTCNRQYWQHYLGQDFPAFLMPYAVDNDYFASRSAEAATTRAQLQAELGLDPERPVILFASKLQQRKHCDDLLEAYLAVLPQCDSKPYLVIVGDGEMREGLQRRVGQAGIESVRFPGFRNQSELPRVFDLCNVFVLPSRHEAWGLIVNEAMACSKAVIVSSDVGCAVDLVQDGSNGFVYAVGNTVQLQEHLLTVLEPGRAAGMGARSFEILSAWGYREDVEGLRAALHFVTRLPTGHLEPEAETTQHESHAHPSHHQHTQPLGWGAE